VIYESISQRVSCIYFFRLERCNRRLSRTPSFNSERESIGRATRTNNLSRGHRVIFPPGARTERSRVGEVPANDRRLLCSSRGTCPSVRRRTIYTPVTHTRATRNLTGMGSARSHTSTYACRYTRTVSSNFSSPPLSTVATAWRLEFAPRLVILLLGEMMATRGRGHQNSWKNTREQYFS